MPQILKEGKANKKEAWFVTCPRCKSEIKFIQGDPYATDPVIYKCDISTYQINYVCPVCRKKASARSGPDMYVSKDERASYKTIVLEDSDFEDMKNWGNNPEITQDELEWIRCRY